MPKIKITVPGLAVPKSVRVTRHGAYNNKRVRSWKDIVRDTAFAQRPPKAPKGVPVSLMLDVWLPWPKKTAKKVISADPYALHTKKPDSDNLLKPVVDGLTEAGLWEDDNQIATMFVEKKYCPRGEEGIEVVINWEK